MGFRLSESHGGKEPANPAICELAFFGSALIKSVGNDFNRKDAIFYQMFESYDGVLNLRFETDGFFGI